jgi:fatty acid desaturase
MVKFAYKSIENQQEQMLNWYKPSIDKKNLKDLMKRKDLPALINTICFFTLLIVSGYLAWISWGTWWAIPAFLIYGNIYSFLNARWHEFGHRSAFKTRWLNDFFYQVCSFLDYFEAYKWRWSHTHHHSRTIHLGIDYEIQVSRPANLINLFVTDFFAIERVWGEFKTIFWHSLGIMTPIAKDCVPESERWKMIWNSRLYMAIKMGIIIWSYQIGSFLPCMFFILPLIYGGTLFQFVAMLQHGGLKADTWDHRESTRTVYFNPILGWLLYLNMNYHIEHHLFPQVPFYNLPKLHKLIKDQCPAPNTSFYDGMKTMVPAILKQAKDPSYHLPRNLPVTP